jgi:NAD(P)H-hydrate repair Nnr-like enzyme with NAD(P)H-hydrate dehydratase domain
VDSCLIWPFAADIPDITDHQRAELHKAMKGTIGILGGSPGCGKTYVAARVISAVANEIGIDGIAVAAPTGKAAVRITQSMQAYGVHYIHCYVRRVLQQLKE